MKLEPWENKTTVLTLLQIKAEAWDAGVIAAIGGNIQTVVDTVLSMNPYRALISELNDGE